jgi:hypothetical protein
MPRKDVFFWSATAVNLLREYAESEKLYASEIAEKMTRVVPYPITKNMVVGACHRHGVKLHHHKWVKKNQAEGNDGNSVTVPVLPIVGT